MALTDICGRTDSGATANPGVRRAMVAAINQKDEMIATMGDDPSTWRVRWVISCQFEMRE